MSRTASRHEPVYRITVAGESATDEQRGRVRRYAISMAVRTACFIGAVLASGTLRWVLVTGAVLLPYIAVVLANAGQEYDRTKSGLAMFGLGRRKALRAAADSPPDAIPPAATGPRS